MNLVPVHIKVILALLSGSVEVQSMWHVNVRVITGTGRHLRARGHAKSARARCQLTGLLSHGRPWTRPQQPGLLMLSIQHAQVRVARKPRVGAQPRRRARSTPVPQTRSQAEAAAATATDAGDVHGRRRVAEQRRVGATRRDQLRNVKTMLSHSRGISGHEGQGCKPLLKSILTTAGAAS